MGDESYTVKEMLSRVEGKIDFALQDHERRIRILEQVKNKWLGASGAILGGAGLLANLFFH